MNAYLDVHPKTSRYKCINFCKQVQIFVQIAFNFPIQKMQKLQVIYVTFKKKLHWKPKRQGYLHTSSRK